MPQRISHQQFLNLRNQTSVIILVEHMGDIVACEPVIRYVKKRYPHHRTAWITKESYTEVLSGHPLLDYLVTVEHLEEAESLSQAFSVSSPDSPLVNLHFSGRYCDATGNRIYNDNDPRITEENYYQWGSLLETFSLAARLPKLTDSPRFHILPDTQCPVLPEHFVVFHCRSNEEDRDWDRSQWKKLLYFFIRRNIHVVEIGFTPYLSSANPLYLDMTSIHSIQTIASVIAKADFFFGVDSGFAHIANALSINGLVIMGKYRNFDNHVPYTGFYSKGHIVRKHGHPASAIPCEDVIASYKKYCSSDLP